jgi:hypothetical protein
VAGYGQRKLLGRDPAERFVQECVPITEPKRLGLKSEDDMPVPICPLSNNERAFVIRTMDMAFQSTSETHKGKHCVIQGAEKPQTAQRVPSNNGFIIFCEEEGSI